MANILVVDDSSLVAGKIAGVLESQGHSVVAIASDGEEGVKMYKNYQPDLVTLDITMPNKCGLQCLEEIIAFDANARAVIISAISHPQMHLELREAGAKAFVEKPFKFMDQKFCKDFADTINGALH